MVKTVSKTRSTKPLIATKPKAVIAKEPHNGNEWYFKITGRGTSGWMTWVCEGDGEDMHWVQLRPSNTSFISAVAAIEPEVMRLAFPHTVTKRKHK